MKTLAAILVCIRLALLSADAQGLQSLAGSPVDPTGFTQDFNSYTPGDQLATYPGWTVVPAGGVGKFKTGSAGVYSDVFSAYSAAGYAPAGFTISPNHEVEGMLYDLGGGGETYQGITCAFQANGDCYILMFGANTLYFTYGSGGVPSGDLSVAIGSIITNGLKLRLRVTGAGDTRRVTGSYDRNEGAGWVTPAGWQDADFGSGRRLDGGKGGIVGYSNTYTLRVDTLTIRNLPPDAVMQDFSSYSAGVSLATLPGWTVFNGTWRAGTGTVYSDTAGVWQSARYVPPGFTVSNNHEAEITIAPVTGGSNHAAVAAAVQPDGSGYFVNTETTSIYLGRISPGGNGVEDYVTAPGTVTAGTKLRIRVTGTGESRRVTGSYSLASGGGWVTPAAFLEKDFGPGKRYDGGTCGVLGYNNVRHMEITDLTVRNLPDAVTQSFDSYGAGVQLSTVPGWTVIPTGVGKFVTGAGGVSSDLLDAASAAGYAPAGFTTSPNHEVEGMVYDSGGGGTYQGIACAIQPSGDGYVLWLGEGGGVYFYEWGTGAGGGVYVVLGPTPNGLKLRLSVTGAGESRRVTASYDRNEGAGWVTPAGWQDKDWGAGKRWDGGKGGIAGYNNIHNIKTDWVTVRNLPPPPPPPTAGLLGWWMADTTGQADNTAVATWQDSHTSDKDMVQATGASQPTLQTNELNGLPVLRFDGVNDGLRATMPVTGSTVTTYMVLKVISPIYNSRIGSIGAAGLAEYNNDASAVLGTVLDAPDLQCYRNGARSEVSMPATGIAFVHTVVFDGALNTGFVNGTAGTSVASTGPLGGEYVSLGAGSTGAPEGPSNIDLAEFLIYNVAHDAATRKAIGTYLSTKWGTPPPP